MSKRRKRRGHFCWSCARVLPNERFSGLGHARHLCKQCQKLGKEELAYRSARRDIERLVDWDGMIRRKRRPQLDRFLEHPNPRMREYAEQVVALDAEMLRELRQAREADEDFYESEGDPHEEDAGPSGEELPGEDSDLPF